MSASRFLVDECVPAALVRAMRRRIPEAFAAQVGEPGAPPKGIPDPELLLFCERERMLLVTADRTTMAGWIADHIEGGHHTWGVLVVAADSSIAQTLDDLALIYEATQDSDWVDVLYYLPLSD